MTEAWQAVNSVCAVWEQKWSGCAREVVLSAKAAAMAAPMILAVVMVLSFQKPEYRPSAGEALQDDYRVRRFLII